MTTQIKAILVSEKQRLSFLPKYFGNRMIAAEQGVYNTLKKRNHSPQSAPSGRLVVMQAVQH